MTTRSSDPLVILPVAFALALSGCAGAGAPETPVITQPAASCGDGIVQQGEACDDANTNDADGCLRTCFRPVSWVSSDPHIHSGGCNRSISPEELLSVSAARGTQITAGLIWGDDFNEERGYFTGSDDRASRPDALLHYDMEISHFPAAIPGHLVLLGLRSLSFSPDPFHRPGSGIPVADWALGQGAVVGMAHGQFWTDDASFPTDVTSCCMPWDFPVQAIRGKLSFFETEQRGGGPPVDGATLRLWSRVLNAGARVAIAGASDYPCIHHFIGALTPRTDAILEGEVTYDAWLEALREGRTAVALGSPSRHLNLRVNGAPLGSEVRVRAGEKLRLSLESDAPQSTTVRTLVNGAVVDSVSVGSGMQAASLQLEVQKSSWIAAATPNVQTSPIYVIVDDQPIRASASDICYLIRYMDHLTGLVNRGKLSLGAETASSLRIYADTKAELKTRFAEAGGASCP
jgi:cysteine-rich repeat protein